jgi:hypothetical protein
LRFQSAASIIQPSKAKRWLPTVARVPNETTEREDALTQKNEAVTMPILAGGGEDETSVMPAVTIEQDLILNNKWNCKYRAKKNNPL